MKTILRLQGKSTQDIRNMNNLSSSVKMFKYDSYFMSHCTFYDFAAIDRKIFLHSNPI